MPRLTKRRSQLRPGWTDEHIEYLHHGCDWFRIWMPWATHAKRTDLLDDYDYDPGVDAARKECWEAYREQVLAEFIPAHPFTRPCLWWMYDAPERRRRVDGIIHPHDDPAWPVERLPKRLFFGIPAMSAVVPGDFKAQYESERSYLTRLNLLTDHERQLSKPILRNPG